MHYEWNTFASNWNHGGISCDVVGNSKQGFTDNPPPYSNTSFTYYPPHTATPASLPTPPIQQHQLHYLPPPYSNTSFTIYPPPYKQHQASLSTPPIQHQQLHYLPLPPPTAPPASLSTHPPPHTGNNSFTI